MSAAVRLVLAAGLAVAPAGLAAQSEDEVTIGFHAVPALIQVDPVPGGGELSEVRILHPVAMLSATSLDGYLTAMGMLNFEGVTIKDGELSPGSWGEGFVDRRHPHTYAHEFMVSAWQPLRSEGQVALSFSLGKGFVPFGSDDPMTRPILRYPVNHHLAQILERAVGTAALRIGPAVLEGALFNGDEPTRPQDWPRVKRFGDSWSGRLTLWPAAGVEVQGSYAHVASPEHRDGAGLDSRKWSASARLERSSDAGHAYAMAEWARTSEGAFDFSTILAEASARRGVFGAAYRFERTERPEELRLADPFRSARPHHDNASLGTTRWTIHSVNLSLVAVGDWPLLGIEPFVEGSLAQVASVEAGVFDPVAFYGDDQIWSVTLGVRLAWGQRLHRMGRYGVATGPAPSFEHDEPQRAPAMHPH